MGNRTQDQGLTRGLARRVTLAAGLLLAGTGSAMAECRADQVNLRGDWGSARFTVEIADDGAERAQGLMNRDELARSAGMLFVYPEPQVAMSFWMRNTRIPLDIIFLNREGVVQRIAHEAVPYDETPLPGGFGAQYVLEINGGLAKSMGIGPGTQLQHPAIGDAAAWPC